jgi:hypothetical protein
VVFRQLLFSNDGNTLVAVADSTVFVLDAFDGTLRHTVRTGAEAPCQVGPLWPLRGAGPSTSNARWAAGGPARWRRP